MLHYPNLGIDERIIEENGCLTRQLLVTMGENGRSSIADLQLLWIVIGYALFALVSGMVKEIYPHVVPPAFLIGMMENSLCQIYT